MRSARDRGHRRDERGASAVEFALIAPLILMLAVGIITSGFAFNQKHQITHATREGGRYGAILPTNQNIPGCGASGPCWAQNIVDLTVERANGDLDTGVPGRRVCVALVEGNPGTVVGGTYIHDTGGGSGTPCPFDDGGADGGRRVQVLAEREGRINAVLFQSTFTLTSRATAKHESGPG